MLLSAGGFCKLSKVWYDLMWPAALLVVAVVVVVVVGRPFRIYCCSTDEKQQQLRTLLLDTMSHNE